MIDTGFPLSRRCADYEAHQGDPVQNLLAPLVREATFSCYGLSGLSFQYITLEDAYNLVKRVMKQPEPKVATAERGE